MSATPMPMVARTATLVFLSLVVAWTLASCGSGNGPGGDPAADNPPPPDPSGNPPPPDSGNGPLDGRYVGTAEIGDGTFFADALLTRDGALRLYVGGEGDGSGALQLSKPGASMQMAGDVQLAATEVSGTGRVFGQDCAPPDVVPLCGGTAEADIRLTAESDHLRGEIELSTPGGVETWSLDLGRWPNYYRYPARAGDLEGQYREVLAEFERDGDAVISIDAEGQLFVQGASSGCTGNGSALPHLDGQATVYDVEVTIASCNATYAHLNGAYSGLATRTPSDYWNYDSLLRVWLSTSDAEAAPAAITMLAEPL